MDVDGHCAHVGAFTDALKKFASQFAQAMFAVALHAAEMYVPASQEPHVVHGARPLALYVDPGTQERIVHVALVAFQA